MPKGIRGSGRPIPVLTVQQHHEFEQIISTTEFKQKLKVLTTWRSDRARWAKGQRHPFLSNKDLKGVAMLAAYETFAKFINDPKPAGKEWRRGNRTTGSTIMGLMVQSMRWALLNEFKRAVRHGGANNVVYAELDSPYSGAGHFPESFGGMSKFVDEDDDNPGGEALQGEVSKVAGEPDPLAVLLLRERLLN